MTQLIVGVLIEIPEHMKSLYDGLAAKENKHFDDVVIDDCIKVIQAYFERIKEIYLPPKLN